MTPNTVAVVEGFYDIVILPPPRIRDHAIELSATLQDLGSKVCLSKDAFKPHLSLYHIPVADKDFSKFIRALRKVVHGRPMGDLYLDGVDFRGCHGAFFLMVKKPQWLNDLANDVINATRPYYDATHDVRPLWGNLTPDMEANFSKYGTPMVNEFFVPHFTFGFLPDEKAAVKGVGRLQRKFETCNSGRVEVRENKTDLQIVSRTLPPGNSEFSVDCIFVAKIGPNLSCQDIVEEIPFWP